MLASPRDASPDHITRYASFCIPKPPNQSGFGSLRRISTEEAFHQPTSGIGYPTAQIFDSLNQLTNTVNMQAALPLPGRRPNHADIN